MITAHESQDPLAIHDATLSAQGGRHPPVGIMTALQTDLLNLMTQFGIGLPRGVVVKMPVEAGAADVGCLAGLCDRESALAFQLHHFSVDRVSPGALFFECAALTR